MALFQHQLDRSSIETVGGTTGGLELSRLSTSARSILDRDIDNITGESVCEQRLSTSARSIFDRDSCPFIVMTPGRVARFQHQLDRSSIETGSGSESLELVNGFQHQLDRSSIETGSGAPEEARWLPAFNISSNDLRSRRRQMSSKAQPSTLHALSGMVFKVWHVTCYTSEYGP